MRGGKAECYERAGLAEDARAGPGAAAARPSCGSANRAGDPGAKPSLGDPGGVSAAACLRTAAGAHPGPGSAPSLVASLDFRTVLSVHSTKLSLLRPAGPPASAKRRAPALIARPRDAGALSRRRPGATAGK